MEIEMKWYIVPMIMDFYYLQRLLQDDIPIRVQYYAKQLLDELTPQLARMLFDYTFAACMGEARHAYNKCYNLALDPGTFKWDDHYDRCDVYREVDQYDPSKCLPELVKLFSEGDWNEGYGGKSWARIAKVALQYWKGELSDTLYIDCTVYLCHNNGIYLDKPFLFTDTLLMFDNLQRFLNLKRNYDILYDVDDSWVIDLSEPVYRLVSMVNKGFEHTATVFIYRTGTILTGDKYSPVTYGSKTIKVVENEWYDEYCDDYYDEDYDSEYDDESVEGEVVECTDER